MSEEQQAAATQNNDEQFFEIKKLYIKDVSFESPNSPVVFTDGEWKPEINVQINGKNNTLGQDLYEAILTITVTVKHNVKTAFLVELQYAGVFAIKGYPKEALRGILGAYCLEALFPYARETLDSLVIKGGFPPLLLKPVNFNAVFQQQLEAEQTANAGKSATH